MRYGRIKPVGIRYSDRRETVHRGLNLFSVLAICSLLGTLIGAVCYLYFPDSVGSDGELAEIFASAGSGFFERRSSGDLSHILIRSFGVSAAFLGAEFLLGFGAVYQPLIFFVTFLRGLFCGISLAGVYGSEFTKTAAAGAAAVLPGIFISLVTTVLAARESLYFSNRLFRICFHEGILREENENNSRLIMDGLLPKLKNYAAHFLIYFAADSAAAAIDALLALLIL